ncbi:hypothetical protein AMEC673_02460 [Alteromonas macleodii str. 'English Channel 673']|jgi:adenylate kinase family enzyme|uniref:AAA domain protein n=2 Tax=Alteromonas macleodii TaxID=28108 RepID=A0AB32ZUH6_ALTME|nr:hypothetical protein AMEC673_02460 [Alteromonas macleodii str. 'English Channel 673']MAE22101.1 hypothetical protein [Pseudomonas sp.]
MIYGPSGVGKESVARELAKRKNWRLFPQHLAFDISCAVIGFGNDGFEAYQRKICIEAFQTFIDKNINGLVFTFCYVHPASNIFIEVLLEILERNNISPNFIKLSCAYDEHVSRVIDERRKNTNKIQSKEYLDNYLNKFDFSTDIPKVQTFHIDNTGMSIQATAAEIEHYLATNKEINILP